MRRIAWVGTMVAVSLALGAWGAPARPASKVKPAAPADEPAAKRSAAAIWPASLEKIAGRYVFAQVASPGGLWESGPAGRKQVSINELSPEMRGRLTHAEIVISGLKLPSVVEASERISPSKRGKLRFYEESAAGRLVMKNLPGIGGEPDDKGEFAGPVSFTLIHASHSNPSVYGVLVQRQRQEATWGAAALDYADLSATPLVEEADPDEELPSVMANARILRSGVEIFAFVTWKEGRGEAERTYAGCVRLVREPPAEITRG